MAPACSVGVAVVLLAVNAAAHCSVSPPTFRVDGVGTWRSAMCRALRERRGDRFAREFTGRQNAAGYMWRGSAPVFAFTGLVHCMCYWKVRVCLCGRGGGVVVVLGVGQRAPRLAPSLPVRRLPPHRCSRDAGARCWCTSVVPAASVATHPCHSLCGHGRAAGARAGLRAVPVQLRLLLCRLCAAVFRRGRVLETLCIWLPCDCPRVRVCAYSCLNALACPCVRVRLPCLPQAGHALGGPRAVLEPQGGSSASGVPSTKVDVEAMSSSSAPFVVHLTSMWAR
jgi:hypothetical protein